MFGFIKKIFTILLTSTYNASNHTKCVSLSNQLCMTQPTLINLRPNDYTQGLRYYPFTVNLDRCVEIFNIFNELSNRVCVPKKTEDLQLSVFNMITEKTESLTLIKIVSFKCECKFDGGKCNSN